MSTLKKALGFLAILGITIFVSINILTGQKNITNWFSIRELQITLGSIMTTLLFLYLLEDRNPLSPNKLKWLIVKTKVLVVLMFTLFLWSILATPTLPVNVSFEGVAKTFDVIETQKNINKTNSSVKNLSGVFSDFKNNQEKDNRDLIKKSLL